MTELKCVVCCGQRGALSLVFAQCFSAECLIVNKMNSIGLCAHCLDQAGTHTTLVVLKNTTVLTVAVTEDYSHIPAVHKFIFFVFCLFF